MADLKDRVVQLLELRSLTQAEAGRRAGFKNTAFINDIVRGHKADVRGQNLSKLAKGLGTSEDFLSGRTDDPQPRRSALVGSYDPDLLDEGESEPERISGGEGEPVDVRSTWPKEAIPELLAHGGMGEGHVIQSVHAGEMRTVDEVKNDYWRIPSDFARSALGTTPLNLLVVECEGDSMSPTLLSGDRVWVNTTHVKPSPDGLYAIRDVFDQVIVKRLEVAQEVPLRLRIISDNPKHTAREVGWEEVRIIGKVVGQFKLF